MVRERWMQAHAPPALGLSDASTGVAPWNMGRLGGESIAVVEMEGSTLARRSLRYTYDLPSDHGRPAVGTAVSWTQAPYAGVGPATKTERPVVQQPAPVGDLWADDDPYLAHLARHRQLRHPYLGLSEDLGVPV